MLPSRSAGAGEAFDTGVVTTLRSLTRVGQPDAFESLTTLFASSAIALLETLREAIARGDAEALGRAAHTLKGSAANLGALRLADACRQLEEVPASDLKVDVTAVARVEAEFEQVQSWLAAERDPSRASPLRGRRILKTGGPRGA